MSTQPEGGDGVKITTREIYDEVRTLSGDVREALRLIPANEQAHRDDHAAFEKRLENHGDRIRDLEAVANGRASVPGTVASLVVDLAQVKAQLNRSAWVPALIAGLVPSILAALIIANLLPKV